MVIWSKRLSPCAGSQDRRYTLTATQRVGSFRVNPVVANYILRYSLPLALNTNMKITASLPVVIASIVVITAVLFFPNNDYRWINHAIIGLTAFSFSVAIIIRAALARRMHWPLTRDVFRTHRKIGLTIGFLITATFIYGIWMVIAREYPLLNCIHGLMGLLIVIMALAQVTTGFYFMRRGMMRSVHRWHGRILAGLIVFQIILGVLLSPLVAGENSRYRVRLTTSVEVVWQPDGIISPDEYFFTRVLDDGNYEISYRTDERHLYVGLKVKTTGWVAVGIQPVMENQMLDADIVFSYNTADTVMVSDQFGINYSHLPDTELGGTDDILEFGGKEEDGFTVIEFKRAMITGDKYDIPLVEGVQTIIWAYGLHDNMEKHIAVGFIEINITPR